MKVALRTRRWGLPYQGGWIEQPAGSIERIQAMLNVYDAVQSWRRSKNWARFAESRPDAWRIVQQVIKLRVQRGD